MHKCKSLKSPHIHKAALLGLLCAVWFGQPTLRLLACSLLLTYTCYRHRAVRAVSLHLAVCSFHAAVPAAYLFFALNHNSELLHRQPAIRDIPAATVPNQTTYLRRKFLLLSTLFLSKPLWPIAAALHNGKLMIAATPEAAKWHSGWEPLPPPAILLSSCGCWLSCSTMHRSSLSPPDPPPFCLF